MKRTLGIAARFWPKVLKSPSPGGCWLWTGHTNVHGYGEIRAGRATEPYLRAHRVSWELHSGPVPAGLDILHHCDNPPCVNPAHLFLGTRAENNFDRHRKGRSKGGSNKGADNPRAKLTEGQVREIRRLYASGGISQTKLGEKFQVAQTLISHIVQRKIWAHLDEGAHG